MTSRRPESRPAATEATRIVATRRPDEPAEPADSPTRAEGPAGGPAAGRPAATPTARLGLARPHQRVLAGVVAVFLLIAAAGASLWIGSGGDPQREPTTTAVPASTSTLLSGAPAPPPPASATTTASVDCAALEAQRRELDERKRQINRSPVVTPDA